MQWLLPMKILYIGGTGEISYACVQESLALGQEVTVLNRGLTEQAMPPGVRPLVGDLSRPDAYAQLGSEKFDCICQFAAFDEARLEADLECLAERTAQYVFISSASAYSKPIERFEILTESTPLDNPFWDYSQKKIRIENALKRAHEQGRIQATIVRPSHTYRRRFPSAIGGGHWTARRMLEGKSIVVHGDGSSLWTLTHAEDFARPFVQLLGNSEALGEDFHITGDGVHSWDEIFHAMAQALGVEAKLVHVASESLIAHEPAWRGKLLGDKSPSTIFDNSKVKSVAGDFETEITLQAGFASVAPIVRSQLDAGAGQDPQLDQCVANILRSQGLS